MTWKPRTGATLLVTAVGRRNYLVEQLVRAKRPEDTLLVGDCDRLAPALGVDGALPLITPRLGTETEDWLWETCSRFQVDAVLSLHDYEICHLSHVLCGPRFDQVDFIGPGPDTAAVLIDKLAFQHYLADQAPELGIPTLSWLDWPALAGVDRDGSSWVVKDRYGSGSSGLQFLDSIDEVEAIGTLTNTRSGWHPRAGVAPVELIIQPAVSGTEYNVDLFFDRDGTLSGHCAKQKIRMRGGETDAARVLHEAPEGLIESLRGALAPLRLRGNVDVDVMRRADGRFAVLDVNPRFGGGYAFSCKAGYDAAHGVWALARGTEIGRYLQPTRSMVAAKYLEVIEYTERTDEPQLGFVTHTAASVPVAH